MVDKLICQVCNKNEALGVACIPGIPMSVAYCKECLEHEAQPEWAIRANVECCGGPNQVFDGYLDTIVYFDGKYMTIAEVFKINPYVEPEW